MGMEQLPFYPGDGTHIDLPLDRFIPPIHPGAVARWLENHIQKGTWIMDPFCSNPMLDLEAADAGYNVFIVCNNPIVRLILEVLAHAPQNEDFLSVLALLGSVRRGDERLEGYIQSLYKTQCPSCREDTVLESAVWKRDPYELIKCVAACPKCSTEDRTFIDERQLEIVKNFEKMPLQRVWALEQLGSLTDEQRSLAQEVIDAYSPRSLYVLFTLINMSKASVYNLPKAAAGCLVAQHLRLWNQFMAGKRRQVATQANEPSS